MRPCLVGSCIRTAGVWVVVGLFAGRAWPVLGELTVEKMSRKRLLADRLFPRGEVDGDGLFWEGVVWKDNVLKQRVDGGDVCFFHALC